MGSARKPEREPGDVLPTEAEKGIRGQRFEPIALDSETMLLGPGNIAPRPVCFTSAKPGGALWIERADQCRSYMRRAIERQRTVWANAPFDLAVACEHLRLWKEVFHALDEGRVHDVQTREKLLDIAKGRFRWHENEETGDKFPVGYSLGDISRRRRIGKKVYADEWRLNYYKLRNTPLKDWPREAKIYAMIDAHITLGVFDDQETEVARDEWGHLAPSLACEAEAVRGHFALHLISAWGFPTNPEAVEALHRRCQNERDNLFPELVESGLIREDGTRDTKAAKARVLAAYGEQDCPITATGIDRMRGLDRAGESITPWPRQRAIKEGYISCSKDVCWETDDDVLHKYARYGQLANLLSKDVPHLRHGTIVPVQAGYQPVMETFRTSSTGFNIQNLRREPGVRECFRPRPGHVIVACDFDTAELVSLAQVTYTLFGFSDMRDIINAGEDIHLRVAAYLLGVSYEEAAKLRKGDDPKINALRQLSKALNFGLPGGMGSQRFAGYAANYLRGTDLTVTPGEAGRLKKLWMGWFREMPHYFEWVRQQMDEESGLYYAQHPVTGRCRGGMFYTACANNTFQELTAFGAKAAAYAVARAQHTEPRSPLYGTKTLAFVHDELLVEVPEDDMLTKRCKELERVMCAAYNRFTPDVPVSAEATAMRVWSKKAKTVYDASGNIVVWEPKRKAA